MKPQVTITERIPLHSRGACDVEQVLREDEGLVVGVGDDGRLAGADRLDNVAGRGEADAVIFRRGLRGLPVLAEFAAQRAARRADGVSLGARQEVIEGLLLDGVDVDGDGTAVDEALHFAARVHPRTALAPLVLLQGDTRGRTGGTGRGPLQPVTSNGRAGHRGAAHRSSPPQKRSHQDIQKGPEQGGLRKDQPRAAQHRCQPGQGLQKFAPGDHKSVLPVQCRVSRGQKYVQVAQRVLDQKGNASEKMRKQRKI